MEISRKFIQDVIVCSILFDYHLPALCHLVLHLPPLACPHVHANPHLLWNDIDSLPQLHYYTAEPTIWNNLPQTIRQMDLASVSLSSFKKQLKIHFFSIAYS